MPGIIEVISTSIVKKCQLIKARFMGPSDIRTPKDAAPYGWDSCPIAGARMIYTETRNKGKYYTYGCVTTERKTQPGEVRIFSTDAAGGDQAYIYLRAAGNIIEIGGADNNAVKFNELKTEFNKLKSDHNNLVSVVNSNAVLLGSHTHPYINLVTPAVTSPSGVPGQTGSANTSNIDNAKNSKIKTNS